MSNTQFPFNLGDYDASVAAIQLFFDNRDRINWNFPVERPLCHVFDVADFNKTIKSAWVPFIEEAEISHIRAYLAINDEGYLIPLVVPVLEKPGSGPGSSKRYEDQLPDEVSILEKDMDKKIFNFSCPCPPHNCCDPQSDLFFGLKIDPGTIPRSKIDIDGVPQDIAEKWISKYRDSIPRNSNGSEKVIEISYIDDGGHSQITHIKYPRYFLLDNKIDKVGAPSHFRLYHAIIKGQSAFFWSLFWVRACLNDPKTMIIDERDDAGKHKIEEPIATDITPPNTIDPNSPLWQASQ